MRLLQLLLTLGGLAVGHVDHTATTITVTESKTTMITVTSSPATPGDPFGLAVAHDNYTEVQAPTSLNILLSTFRANETITTTITALSSTATPGDLFRGLLLMNSTATYTNESSGMLKPSAIKTDLNVWSKGGASKTGFNNQTHNNPFSALHTHPSHNLSPGNIRNWTQTFRTLARREETHLTIVVNPSPTAPITSTANPGTSISTAASLLEITITLPSSKATPVLNPTSDSTTRRISFSQSPTLSIKFSQTSYSSTSSPTHTTAVWDYWKGTKWQTQGAMSKARSVPVNAHNWLRRFRNFARQTGPITITINPATSKTSSSFQTRFTPSSSIVSTSTIWRTAPSTTGATTTSSRISLTTLVGATSAHASVSPTPTTTMWDYWKGTKWRKQGTQNKARSIVANTEEKNGDISNRKVVLGYSVLIGALVLLFLSVSHPLNLVLLTRQMLTL
jgi:hypothetical protein